MNREEVDIELHKGDLELNEIIDKLILRLQADRQKWGQTTSKLALIEHAVEYLEINEKLNLAPPEENKSVEAVAQLNLELAAIVASMRKVIFATADQLKRKHIKRAQIMEQLTEEPVVKKIEAQPVEGES